MAGTRLSSLPAVLGALRAARRLGAHDGWSAEQVAADQRRRLLDVVRHAAARSPFYRERFAGIELSDDLDVTALPTLDKATMLDRFDDLVTDRRLTLGSVEEHLRDLDRAGHDPLLLGEYRAMASGGTSGRRGVFVYSRADWAGVLTGFFRTTAYSGLTPRLPRLRVAIVAADHPLHMSTRIARSSDVGVHRILRLDARTPVEELAAALDAFQPVALLAFPSVAAALASEQLAGRLRIAPHTVVTMSEVQTTEMRDRVAAAWGSRPFNNYAATETALIAQDCEHHAGLHVFSELVHLEVVDDAGRPVPAGEPGSRLLVTNLFNRTQPLIRYELTDLVTLSPEPCPCGRPHPLLTSVDGRSDDVLDLPSTRGGTIAVHPLTIRSPLADIPGLSEYCVVHSAGTLTIRAVLADDGAHDSIPDEIATRLHAALAQHGIAPPPITVEPVASLPRHPQTAKRKLVERVPSQPTTQP